MEIEIRPSIISSFLNNGEIKPHCPRKIRACTIDKTHQEEKEVFKFGLYFEQLIGIGNAYSDEPIRLKRKALTAKQKKEATEAGIPESEFPYMGAMYVDEERLISQAENFKRIAPYYAIKTDDCQKKIEKEWHLSKEVSNDIQVILRTTYDIRTPFADYSKEVDIFYEDAIIDIKTTSNIYASEYNNDYSWKFPANRDCSQGKLTHYITGLPFIYMVWDYAPAENYMSFPLILEDAHMHAFNQDVLKTLKLYLKYEESGWKANGSYQECNTCPLSNDCSKKTMIKPSVPIRPSH